MTEEEIVEEDLKIIEKRKEAKIRLEEVEECLKLFEWLFKDFNANKEFKKNLETRIKYLKNI